MARGWSYGALAAGGQRALNLGEAPRIIAAPAALPARLLMLPTLLQWPPPRPAALPVQLLLPLTFLLARALARP